ncbi:hypothetical protein Q9295_10935 [Xinfangfangia sp. CPCC 101601]|uniref:Uncharacterized protein n=1 Tax=Pseudogemmobacter lacusdianii TaxID=3069608 RepID=A0ABU0VYQ7_9RHOB|nr:hypothetical protein [Xinfangfangia sp. CPCC 101601]MDQ2066891.1 hypothetical protein [Xinfangfangia sp. CPCC 101601]
MFGENCVVKWHDFIAARPNEIGDALAGLAGSLAFIWVIVTVSLQATQLRYQREELQATREEIRQQRQATQDMARSMKVQADRSERDEAAELQKENAILLAQRAEAMVDFLASYNFETWPFSVPNSSGGRTKGRQELYYHQNTRKTGDALYSFVCQVIIENCRELAGLKSSGHITSYPKRDFGFDQLKAMMVGIAELKEFLSPSGREFFSRVPIEEAISEIGKIIDGDYWRPSEGNT